MQSPATFLRSLFDAAVASALPENCLARWLPAPPDGRIVVVGAGKAAASMAAELEHQWLDVSLEGMVIVPYGHTADCRSIQVIEAGHPVPDSAGKAASEQMMQSVAGLTASDSIICLLSGGGSALLSLPAPGISFEEKQSINRALLRSGAAIHEINAVRKKLSAVKGGQLAAAADPARILTLVISDVPGNDPSLVASGPTIPDNGSPSDALHLLDRYGIEISNEIRAVINSRKVPRIVDPDVRVLATSDDALIAASVEAAGEGVTPYSLGDVNQDARQLAREHAALVQDIVQGRGPVEAPCVLISGGETTVQVTGNGKGGRNSEYALALAVELAGQERVYALAADTDGIDGAGDNAGALLTPTTLSRAEDLGLDPLSYQNDNNSYAFFDALGDLITTGPTLTNVNDFRAIYIDAA